MYRLLEQADASQGNCSHGFTAETELGIGLCASYSTITKGFTKPGVSCFLEQYGYVDLCVEKALEHLQKRIAASDGFPHEIGIFLDYPLADVIGFIENQGCNCKCSGCWKVYQNEEDAMETFARYKKCTRIYTELWMQGRSINKLTVSA